MVKTPKLVPTLKVECYELLMHNQPSDDYDVIKYYNIIDRIKVYLKRVKGQHWNLVYSYVDMPIDLFKK